MLRVTIALALGMVFSAPATAQCAFSNCSLQDLARDVNRQNRQDEYLDNQRQIRRGLDDLSEQRGRSGVQFHSPAGTCVIRNGMQVCR
jgi:hypothetical protein